MPKLFYVAFFVKYRLEIGLGLGVRRINTIVHLFTFSFTEIHRLTAFIDRSDGFLPRFVGVFALTRVFEPFEGAGIPIKLLQ